MTQLTMSVQIDDSIVELINVHPLRKMFTRNQLVAGLLTVISTDLTPSTFKAIATAIAVQNEALMQDLLADGNQLKLLEKTENIKPIPTQEAKQAPQSPPTKKE